MRPYTPEDERNYKQSVKALMRAVEVGAVQARPRLESHPDCQTCVRAKHNVLFNLKPCLSELAPLRRGRSERRLAGVRGWLQGGVSQVRGGRLDLHGRAVQGDISLTPC